MNRERKVNEMSAYQVLIIMINNTKKSQRETTASFHGCVVAKQNTYA